MKKHLLIISLIFSFVAMGCLVCSIALAQEGDMPPPEDDTMMGPVESGVECGDGWCGAQAFCADAASSFCCPEGTTFKAPNECLASVAPAPLLDESGMIIEELMTDISEDMVEVLDAAAKKAIEEEDRIDELKIDEMVNYEDLDVKGDARILPDSFLYPVKNLGRTINTFLTFDTVKKAEKDLDYANKKIMESRQLVEEKIIEEKVITEKVAKAVEKAIISAEKDLEDISDIAEKLKEQRAEDAPKIEKFLDKVVDHTLKQQKVIEKLEEKLPEKNLAKVIEAKEKALEHFGETMTKVAEKHEEITERITKVMDAQEGSDLKDLKNLEVLEVIKEKIPEEAREAIENVQEDRTRVFQEKFKEMPEEVRAEKVNKYLGDMRGNALRQFDMLDDMKRSAWVDEDLIKELDLLKDKMVKKFETKFTGFKETVMRDQFMGHLMDGDPDDFRTLEQIDMRMGPMDIVVPPELAGVCFDPLDCERYCMSNPDVPACDMMGPMPDYGPPPEVREAMKRVHDESVNKFKDRFAGDPEAMKRSEAIQKALRNPDAIDFRLLDMVYETMPEEQKRFADDLRREVENKMVDMMKMAPMGPQPMMDFGPEGPPPGFTPPQPYFMMNKFIDPNPESMEMLARLRDRIPEEDRFYMEQAMDKQMNRMTDHMYRMDDQEMFNRMNYQMQEDITVRQEIERRDEGFFNNIDMRRRQLEEEMRMLEEEKMRRMDEMKMEMMRGQREFMPMMMPQPMMTEMGPPPEEMMRMFEEQQRTFQDKMKERGIDPCDFNNDGRVDEYESSQCRKGQQMAPQPQDQGFFNKVKNIVPFRGDQGPQPTGPCDFNGDGYVDLYESKQCAEMPPPMPVEEKRGIFDRMRDFVPFVQPKGPQCGNIQCPTNDYCADPSTGFCCPNGTTYQSPNQCVGQAQVPQDRGFIDKFRDFMPLVPNSGMQCGSKRCGSDAYCANPTTGKCCPNGHKYNPSDNGCLEFYPGSPHFDPCDYNEDGNIDDSERQRCYQEPVQPITGWCGDGRCEPGEMCPQDCETVPAGVCDHDTMCDWNETLESCPDDCGVSCNNNGVCEWGEGMNNCPSDCGTACDYDGYCNEGENMSSCPNDCGGGMMSCTSFVPIGQSCNLMTGTCCSDGMCSNMNGPGVCESMSGGGGCQCSWGWSDSCNCADQTTGCDRDGICDSNETMTSCPEDCSGGTQTCSSRGGTCCNICAEGSYISGTDCNCCGTCQGDSCPDNEWTSNAGACDYSVCINGCTFNNQGCPSGCMTTTSGCGNNVCDNGETMTSCPSDCQSVGTCPESSYTTSAGACNYSNCPNGCNFDYYGCPSGCMTATSGCGNNVCDNGETMTSCPSDCGTTTGGCGSYADSSSCTSQSGCVWCEGESSPYSCFGTGHVCGGSAGCQCSCGWSDTCECGSMCPGGTNCDYDGMCDWDESETYCPDDCAPITTTACDNDGMCDSDETMSSCPADCGTTTQGCTCADGFWSDICDCAGHETATACDYDGYCDSDESMSSCPDDCSGGSGGCTCSDGFWSDVCDCAGHEGGGSMCGDGMCDSSETTESCPSDCGTAMEGCTCADGFWSDTCDCAGHESMGCQCSCGWSETCECFSMCPEPPPATGGCDCGDGTMSEACCSGPMMRGEYPNQTWLRRIFAFIFGF